MSLASDDWVVISTVQGQFEEAQLKAFLDGHEIPTQAHGATLRGTHGFSIGGLGSVEILVRRTDLAKARDLIAQAERGELAVSDIDPDRTM